MGRLRVTMPMKRVLCLMPIRVVAAGAGPRGGGEQGERAELLAIGGVTLAMAAWFFVPKRA